MCSLIVVFVLKLSVAVFIEYMCLVTLSGVVDCNKSIMFFASVFYFYFFVTKTCCLCSYQIIFSEPLKVYVKKKRRKFKWKPCVQDMYFEKSMYTINT